MQSSLLDIHSSIFEKLNKIEEEVKKLQHERIEKIEKTISRIENDIYSYHSSSYIHNPSNHEVTDKSMTVHEIAKHYAFTYKRNKSIFQCVNGTKINSMYAIDGCKNVSSLA